MSVLPLATERRETNPLEDAERRKAWGVERSRQVGKCSRRAVVDDSIERDITDM